MTASWIPHRQPGQYLRAQTPDSVRDLLHLSAQFVDWAWSQTPTARVRHAGWTEYFFEDTEIEVYGDKIQGACFNYEGKRALSWQVLWKGPFVLDHQLDGASDVSEHLPSLLTIRAMTTRTQSGRLSRL